MAQGERLIGASAALVDDRAGVRLRDVEQLYSQALRHARRPRQTRQRGLRRGRRFGANLAVAVREYNGGIYCGED